MVNATQRTRVFSPMLPDSNYDAHVAAHPRLVQRARRYLSIVYPAGRFASAHPNGASDLDALRFFRSLLHVYQGAADTDVPLDALEPTMFGVGSNASAVARCASGADNHAVAPLRAVLSRHPYLISRMMYRGLVPCREGFECVDALNRFAPNWLDGVETTNAFFEVRHFAHETWWFGTSHPPGQRMRSPSTWFDFEDMARLHGSGWWYIHAPGSGVFYHAGRTLAAPTKIAMFVRLLEKWLAANRPADVALRDDLQRVANSNDLPAFLVRLLSVRDGVKTCRQAGVPHCYDEIQKGTLYKASWTLYDVPYDDLSLRLGRALGYETLLFSASFLRPDLLQGKPAALWSELSAGAEMVDLRRPAWASRVDNNDTSAAWAATDAPTRADAWAADVRRRGTISLRDPLDPEHGPALPCELSMSHHLACKGHVSWDFRESYPALLQCPIMLTMATT